MSEDPQRSVLEKFSKNTQAAEAALRDQLLEHADKTIKAIQDAVNEDLRQRIASATLQAYQARIEEGGPSKGADDYLEDHVDLIGYGDTKPAALAVAHAAGIDDAKILNLVAEFAWHHTTMGIQLELDSIRERKKMTREATSGFSGGYDGYDLGYDGGYDGYDRDPYGDDEGWAD